MGVRVDVDDQPVSTQQNLYLLQNVKRIRAGNLFRVYSSWLAQSRCIQRQSAAPTLTSILIELQLPQETYPKRGSDLFCHLLNLTSFISFLSFIREWGISEETYYPQDALHWTSFEYWTSAHFDITCFCKSTYIRDVDFQDPSDLHLSIRVQFLQFSTVEMWWFDWKLLGHGHLNSWRRTTLWP